VKGLR